MLSLLASVTSVTSVTIHCGSFTVLPADHGTANRVAAAMCRCAVWPCIWAHFLRARLLFALSSMTRVLVLGAERDVVYSPVPLIPPFRARFANCTVTIAADQKHIVCRIQTATLLWTKRSLSSSQTNDNDIRVAECAAVQRLQKPQGIADLWLVTERRPCHSLVARRSKKSALQNVPNICWCARYHFFGRHSQRPWEELLPDHGIPARPVRSNTNERNTALAFMRFDRSAYSYWLEHGVPGDRQCQLQERLCLSTAVAGFVSGGVLAIEPQSKDQQMHTAVICDVRAKI